MLKKNALFAIVGFPSGRKYGGHLDKMSRKTSGDIKLEKMGNTAKCSFTDEITPQFVCSRATHFIDAAAPFLLAINKVNLSLNSSKL